MHRYNIVTKILMILTIGTFALAVPVPVQEKRQLCVDKVHIPGDVITVLGKRALREDLHMLWNGPWRFGNVWGEPSEGELLSDGVEGHVQDVHAPPPNLVQAPELHAPLPGLAEEPLQEVHAPPPNLVQAPELHPPQPGLPEEPLQEVNAPPHDPADFDRESMVFGDDAPPGSPEWSTDSESEGWHTAPSSPRAESPTGSYSN